MFFPFEIKMMSPLYRSSRAKLLSVSRSSRAKPLTISGGQADVKHVLPGGVDKV
jgi:hypothetical protein